MSLTQILKIITRLIITTMGKNCFSKLFQTTLNQQFVLILLSTFLLNSFESLSQCTAVNTTPNGKTGKPAPTCGWQTEENVSPRQGITFNVTNGVQYQARIDNVNWDAEVVTVFNEATGAAIGGAQGNAGATYTWTSGFTGTVRVIASRNCVAAANYGWFDGMNSAVLSYRNRPPGGVTVSGGGAICAGESITATGGARGFIYFQGTTSNGTSTANPSTSEEISAPGTYYFRSRTPQGCWGGQGSTAVTINPGPTGVSAGTDVSVCEGGSVGLSGSVDPLPAPSPTGYCTSVANSTNDTKINRVQLNTINNTTTGGGCTDYRDYTALSTSVNKGSSHTLTVVMGTCNGDYTKRVSVWIDWNRNGTFDGGEIVMTNAGTGTGTQTVTSTVNVPVGASGGLTRMRVVCQEAGSVSGPCGGYSWGETQDYTINILPLDLPTISWSGGPIVSGGTTLTPSVNPTTTTTYTMTATANGCSVEDDVEVTVTTLDMTSSPAGFEACEGGTVDLNVTGETDWSGLPTGGTITTVGNDRIHTFNSSGTFNSPQALSGARLLVIGGGGGGGSNGGGGGGAGGVYQNNSYGIASGATGVTVGAGAPGHPNSTAAPAVGGQSAFGGITAGGGGGGASRDNGPGGSAGGAGTVQGSGGGGGGAEDAGRRTPGGGANSGGFGIGGGCPSAGGGGGGAGGAGGNAGSNLGGNGGIGVQNDITGSNLWYAAGGGGGTTNFNVGCGSASASCNGTPCASIIQGVGGSGIGGNGESTAGAANTGSGGGAERSGGSGVVIVRYTQPKWESSNTSVATVNELTGVVTGVSNGTAEITYTSPTGCSVSETVTINAAPDAGTLSGGQNICVAGNTTFSSNGDGGGTWSSDNTGIATVNASGVVTGVANGSTTIRYTVSASGCSDDVATRAVNVTATPNAGTLSGGQNICVAGTTTFSSNGDAGGTWSSDDTGIATVNGSGVVTGVADGSTTIRYTITGTGGCSNDVATRTVNVTAAPNAGALSGGQNICVAGTTTFSSNGDAGGTWSSDDTGIATVNGSGVVTGVADGSTTIRYTVTGTGGCSDDVATRTVNVTAAPNAGSLSGTQDVCVGSTTNFSSDGDGGGTWSSDAIGTATVNGSGVVTGVADGSTTIRYTITGTGGCSNDVATRTVDVNAVPDAGSLSGTQDVCVGATTSFTSDGDAGGAWSSDATGTATVNGSGVVTGVANGSTTIRYTVSAAGCSNDVASRTVNVGQPTTAITVNANTIASGDYLWNGYASNEADQLPNWYIFDGTDYSPAGVAPTSTDDVFVVTNADAVNCVEVGRYPLIENAVTFNLNNVYIGSGAQLDMDPNSTLNVTGDFTNDGTFTPSAGEVVFNGTGAQNIRGASAVSFYDLTNNKASGNLVLQRDITVNNDLTMTSGNIDLNGNDLTLGTTASIVGESNATRILGSTGLVTTTRTFAAPLAGENFGNMGISISTALAPGAMTVSRGHTRQTGVDGNLGIERYFILSPTVNSGLDASMSFSYFNGEVPAGYDPAEFALYRSTDGGSTWVHKDESSPGANSVGLSGIDAFSSWTVSDHSIAPLPVDFEYLNGDCEKGKVTLTWRTASELNASHFEVERSNDGYSWDNIGWIEAQGTTPFATDYSFEDPENQRGNMAYYQLRQFDFDGVQEVFGPISVTCKGEEDYFVIYPNPTSGVTNASFTWSKEEQQIDVKLIDMTGKVLMIRNVQAKMGTNVVSIDMNTFQKGIYRIVLSNDKETIHTGKVVKN